jgi:2-polyprenyl-3-methyl-5-hydroxy-6-metoxy-1,4-benzoquinol methylase
MSAAHDDPCPLCGSTESAFVVTGYDRFAARTEDFSYSRCGGCGLLHLAPLPQPDVIPGFYPDDYDPHSGETRRRRDKWINRMATRYYYATDSVDGPATARLLFRMLSGRVMRDIRPPRGANRLLDVGCAAGNLIQRYRDLGWDVKGVEMSANAVEIARGRGLDVHLGTIYEAPFETGSFDMIVLSHVIEHVLEPDRFLARCAEFLAPGGLLVLATPNADGIGLSLYGSCWFPLDAPRHLMLFDPKTIRMLGEKAGLSPVRIATLAEPRMLCESRHYVLTQGKELPGNLEERRRVIEESIQKKEEHRGFRRLARPLTTVSSWFGRGDILEAEFVRR